MILELELFAPETVQMDSPRLLQIREHDIQTHFAAHADPPWMAIPMQASRKRLANDAGATPERTADIPTILTHYCRLLDDAGLICEATTESEAQEMALDLVLGARR